MSSSVNDKRSYISPVRTERARATRRAVVSAAMELFLELGYAATTIAEVARRAGVSADTIYHLFGSKRSLLKQALDHAIGGDDRDVPFLERPAPQRMRHETDQRRQIRMFAAGMSQQLDRFRPMDDVLRSAAAVDEEIAALRIDVQLRQRRSAMTAIAGWLAARGPLSVGLDEAAAVLWTCTSPEVHRMFRVDWGWEPAQYENWLRVTLAANLLAPQ
ncbi:MAG: TetR/AcrR family transcriptional regulator [Nocardioidaceae bacterium]